MLAVTINRSHLLPAAHTGRLFHALSLSAPGGDLSKSSSMVQAGNYICLMTLGTKKNTTTN